MVAPGIVIRAVSSILSMHPELLIGHGGWGRGWRCIPSENQVNQVKHAARPRLVNGDSPLITHLPLVDQSIPSENRKQVTLLALP